MKTICVCGSTSPPTDDVWTVHGIRIVECSDCGVRRVPEPAVGYREQYTSGKYHAEGSDDLPHVSAGRAPHKDRFAHDYEVGRKRIEALKTYKVGGSLLDAGCANGAVMEAASQAGFDAEGVDLSKEAFAAPSLEHCVRVGDIRKVGFQRRSKDVVMFNDSFEHFIDPLSALKAANGILKRNGILVIDVPDMGSQMARESGQNFHHVKPHEHLWYFTGTQLRELLEREGFTVLGMEVPVPGKITAYASPKTAVTHVKIFGPPGIGDIIWTMHKWKAIRDKEWPCRIEYVVCMEGDRKMTTRSRDFVELSKWIDSFTAEPLPLPPDNGCPDPALPHYNLFANGFVDSKVPPYVGGMVETWRPELETDWDIGVEVPDAAMEQAQIRLRKLNGNYIALYMSSNIYNSITLEPVWTASDWADLCIGLKSQGLTPVILGAGWDEDYTHNVAYAVAQKGYKPSEVFLNLTSRTPLPLAMAIMRQAKVTVGIAAGLPIIAGYFGWPTIILWPVHGVSPVKVCEVQEHGWNKEFGYSWVPPHIRESGSYKWLTVGKFDSTTLTDTVLSMAGKTDTQHTQVTG